MLRDTSLPFISNPFEIDLKNSTGFRWTERSKKAFWVGVKGKN
jgi:hypothetical protein